jgi:hypothetical protein
MDLPALKDVITSAAALAAVVVSGASVFQIAKTARRGRSEQRAADAYLAVLRLVEQEAEWLGLQVYHHAYDRETLAFMGVSALSEVPRPVAGDRATAAAYLAAYGSSAVRAKHSSWREAADAVGCGMQKIVNAVDTPEDRPEPEEVFNELKEVIDAEKAARQALEDAVASELRHR